MNVRSCWRYEPSFSSSCRPAQPTPCGVLCGPSSCGAECRWISRWRAERGIRTGAHGQRHSVTGRPLPGPCPHRTWDCRPALPLLRQAQWTRARTHARAGSSAGAACTPAATYTHGRCKPPKTPPHAPEYRPLVKPPGCPDCRIPIDTFDCPHFSFRMLSFVEAFSGNVCGLRNSGGNGIGEHGHRRVFLSRFFSPCPPVFAISLPLVEAVHTISIVIL